MIARVKSREWFMAPIAVVNTTGFCYRVFHTRGLGFAHEALVFMLFKEGDSTNSGVLTSVLEYIFFGTKSSGLCKHWSSDGEGSWQSGAEEEEDHRITVSAAAYSPALGKGVPALRWQRRVSPSKLSWLSLLSSAPGKYCGSAQAAGVGWGGWGGGVTALLRCPRVLQFCWTRGKFPGKSGTVLLWSSLLRLQGSCYSENVTLCNKPHSRFIGKENPGGGGEVAASCEKQQQTEQGPEFI